MALSPFIVKHQRTGRPVRLGFCQAEMVAHQARGPEEVAATATEQQLAEARALLMPARPALTEGAPDRISVLLAALQAKGIEITPAEMAQAEATLRGGQVKSLVR